MDQFCGISGDVKPLYTDAEFAKSKDFPGRVTYGMMVSSLYSRKIRTLRLGSFP